MKKIGTTQQKFLAAVKEHGSFYLGCGWTWGGDSASLRLAESLVKRGLLVKNTIIIDNGLQNPYQRECYKVCTMPPASMNNLPPVKRLQDAARKAEEMFRNFAGEDPGACLTGGSPEAEACDMADELRDANAAIDNWREFVRNCTRPGDAANLILENQELRAQLTAVNAQKEHYQARDGDATLALQQLIQENSKLQILADKLTAQLRSVETQLDATFEKRRQNEQGNR